MTIKILIIDDEWLIAENNRYLLVSMGYEVSGIATNPQMAIELIQENPPNLILMDIMLSSDEDGISLADRIQAKWNIPIVYATAYASREIIDRAKKTGPYGYVVKPYTDQELHSAIEMALYKFETDSRLNRLNAILNTIRSINRFIVKASTLEELVNGACEIIASNPDYQSCWISMLQPDMTAVVSTQSGRTERFESWNRLLSEGTVPEQLMNFLESTEMIRLVKGAGDSKADKTEKEVSDLLLAKLGRDKQFMGILGAEKRTGTPSDSEEIDLLEEVISDIAYAAANIQMQEEVRKSENIQEVLLKISQAAHLSEDDLVFYEKIKNSISVLMPANNFYVAFANETKNILTFPYFHDSQDQPVKSRKFGNGITEYVIRTGKPLCVNRQEIKAMIRNKIIDEFGTVPGSWLGIPLSWHRNTFGVMAVQSYNEDIVYGSSETEMLGFVANNLSAVINRRQDREAIIERQRSLDTLINNVPDEIFFKDLKHRFIICNSAVIDHLNMQTTEDVLGKTDLDFYPLETAEKYLAEEEEILNRGASFINRENQSIQPDGTPRWNLSTKLPCRDSKGRITGIVGINRDITNVKQAELKIQRLYKQQKQINELVLILGRINELDQMYEAVSEKITDAISVQVLIISFYHSDTRELTAEFVKIGSQKIDTRELPPLPLEPPGHGIQSPVIHTGKVHYIPNLKVREDDNTAYVMSDTGAVFPTSEVDIEECAPRSCLSVPLKVDETIIGVMQVQNDIPDGFSREDIELLQGMANVTAIAILKRKLYDDIQYELHERKSAEFRERKLLEQQIAVNKLALALGEVTELSQVFITAYTHLSHLSRISGFEILRFMTKPARLVPEVVIRDGKRCDLDNVHSYHLRNNSRTIYAYVARTYKPRVIGSIPEFLHSNLNNEGDPENGSDLTIPAQFRKLFPKAETGVWAPMRVKGAMVGILQVNSREADSLSARDIDQITSYSNVIAVAVENARLLEVQQREIEERIRIENMLKKSEQRYRSLYEGVPVGYYRSLENDVFVDVNPTLVRLLKYPDAETLLRQKPSSINFDSEKRSNWIREISENGIARGTEIQLRCYDGSTIWALETARKVRDPETGKTYFEGALEDITARVAAEKELQEYQLHLEERVALRTRELEEKQIQLEQTGHLAAMGNMAAGVAHELNTPLAIIQMQTELLQDAFRNSDLKLKQEEADLQLILDNVKKASDIIEHMQDFTAIQPDYMDQISPVELVNWNMKFYRRQFENLGIDLVFTHASNIPMVEIVPQHWEQILLNLVSNARQSLEKDKPDETKTGKRVEIHVASADDNENVRLSVTDNGVGMSRSVKKRCLDPFFTTREVGDGTGMGLTIVYFLVKRYAGNLHIKSSLGQGTTVTVTIPVKPNHLDETSSDKGF